MPAANKNTALIDDHSGPIQEVFSLAQSITDIGNIRSPDHMFWIEAVDDVLIVAVTDADGAILYANQKFCAISGYSQAELIGANHRILNSGLHDRAFFKNMFKTIRSGQTWRGEICNRAKDGKLYWVATTIFPRFDEAGEITHFVACRFDISEQKQAQDELALMANTDGLTGLLNRFAFHRCLENLFEATPRRDYQAAIAMIDLDSFKDINDIYGHQTGDELLKTVAKRILNAVESGDVVARFGGDEMIILFDNLASEADLRERLLRVQNIIQLPLALEGSQNQVFASVGVALYPKDACDGYDLIKKADMALYNAKRLGRNRYEFYSDILQENITKRVSLQQEARLGLLRGEFELYYQPILSLRTNRVDSLEALIRWNHPRLGLLTPSHFWEIFEDQRLTGLLGSYVRDRAVQQAATWTQQGVPFGRIAVNTTTPDFARGALTAELCASLEANRLPPSVIAIEVTEGMFLGKQAERVRGELTRLHEAGFEIAFDDFGTGFASLTHLKELPLDRIKIDRSFVKDMERHDADWKIVRGIVDIAHSLGLIVTAEGIENLSQLHLLRELGCDKIQGYLVAKPLPCDAIPDICRRDFAEMRG